MLRDAEENVQRPDSLQLIRSKIDKNLLKAYEQYQRSDNLRAKPRFFDVGQVVIKHSFAMSNTASKHKGSR